MNESDLSQKLRKELESDPHAVVFKLWDRLHIGWPDFAYTWGGMTTWLEVKYANPKIIDREIQHRTMLQLERAGSAFYVVFFGPKSPHLFENQYMSAIVKPSQLKPSIVASVSWVGHDFVGIHAYLRNEHLRRAGNYR